MNFDVERGVTSLGPDVDNSSEGCFVQHSDQTVQGNVHGPHTAIADSPLLHTLLCKEDDAKESVSAYCSRLEDAPKGLLNTIFASVKNVDEVSKGGTFSCSHNATDVLAEPFLGFQSAVKDDILASLESAFGTGDALNIVFHEEGSTEITGTLHSVEKESADKSLVTHHSEVAVQRGHVVQYYGNKEECARDDAPQKITNLNLDKERFADGGFPPETIPQSEDEGIKTTQHNDAEEAATLLQYPTIEVPIIQQYSPDGTTTAKQYSTKGAPAIKDSSSIKQISDRLVSYIKARIVYLGHGLTNNKGNNRNWLTYLLFLACFVLPRITAANLGPVQLDLEIQDLCWYYKAEDPVLVCTVQSMDLVIRWRQNWELIARGGQPVGDDRHQFSVSATSINAVKQERLQLSSIITNLALNDGSEFLCENLGSQSEHLRLHIPDCEVCGACPTSSSTSFADKEISEGNVPDDDIPPETNSLTGNLSSYNKHYILMGIALTAAVGCGGAAVLYLVYMWWRRQSCKAGNSDTDCETCIAIPSVPSAENKLLTPEGKDVQDVSKLDGE